MQSQLISFLRRLDWKMEVGGEEYDYQRQQVAGSYFWLYPSWIGEFEFFLYLDIYFGEKVCFRRAKGSSTIALRGLGYQITTDAC